MQNTDFGWLQCANRGSSIVMNVPLWWGMLITGEIMHVYMGNFCTFFSILLCTLNSSKKMKSQVTGPFRPWRGGAGGAQGFTSKLDPQESCQNTEEMIQQLDYLVLGDFSSQGQDFAEESHHLCRPVVDHGHKHRRANRVSTGGQMSVLEIRQCGRRQLC